MVSIPGFANKWYYDTESGQLENTSQALAVTSNLGLAGWHELNIPGTDTGAQAAAAAKAEFPTGKAPTYAPVTPATVLSTAAGEAGVPATSTLGEVKDIVTALGSANLWIRVAKVVIGGIVLVIGLAHITGASNTVAAVARKAPLPV
jgi:hypothetical protein